MTDDGIPSDQTESQAPVWSTHDPACDQCRSKKQRCGRQRPTCSNCKRLNLACDYSGRGKKPNQNTELMRRLRDAESRINGLETSVSRIQPYLDTLEANSVLSSLPSVEDLSSYCTTGLQATQSGRLEISPAPESPGTQQERSEERDSIKSLASDCTKTAVAKYGGNNQMSGPLAALNSSLRQISELQEQPMEGMDKRVTVSRPPLAILHGMVTTYFEMFNDSFPIFSRDRIQEHMENYDESANGSHDIAHSLCFNNLILLALMAKVRRHLAQGVPPALESELLKTFSENALGAFGCLESLLQPRIANVQALLSLSLVCQSMCLTDLARRCLQLTHSLWKLLDLRSGILPGSQRPAIDEEHINVFWCIFILETSALMSESKLVSLSVVPEMPFPPKQPGNHARDHFLAAIHIAQLRRDVFASRTAAFRMPTAQNFAARHLEELQKLQSTLGVDAGPFVPYFITDDFQLWLTLSLLTTRLVINEAFPECPSRDTAIPTAQKAILILTSIGMDAGDNLRSQTLLPLILFTESLAAISLLVPNVIRHSSTSSDVELLKSFYQSLKKANMMYPHITFATRLETLVGAVIDFMAGVRLLPDSCRRTGLTPGSSESTVDFSFLDTDGLI